jgi:hypothetical protein
MRSAAERARVLEMVAAGLNDCEISRRCEIPRSTVRGWRAQPEPREWSTRRRAEVSLRELPARDYAYLLGLYLGDGYLAPAARGVLGLRVYLDNRYPAIIYECACTLDRLFPRQRAGIAHHRSHNMVIVSLYSKQWARLLPQHGPGMKHTRPILLKDWQRDLVATDPGRFLRGLIHSDGWRGQNRVTSSTGKQYAYPRYQFCNKSQDIKDLFCWACDLVGVEWRVMNAMNISVAKRGSVAILDEFVGPKR